jgi:hypothetical protein
MTPSRSILIHFSSVLFRIQDVVIISLTSDEPIIVDCIRRFPNWEGAPRYVPFFLLEGETMLHSARDVVLLHLSPAAASSPTPPSKRDVPPLVSNESSSSIGVPENGIRCSLHMTNYRLYFIQDFDSSKPVESCVEIAIPLLAISNQETSRLKHKRYDVVLRTRDMRTIRFSCPKGSSSVLCIDFLMAGY